MKSTRRGSFSVHRSEKTPGSKYSSTSEPIVIVSVTNPFNGQKDVPPFLQELYTLFDSSPEGLYNIADARGVNVSLGEIAQALAMIARSDRDVLHHPNALGHCVIFSSDMVQIGASAFRHPQFGSQPVRVR